LSISIAKLWLAGRLSVADHVMVHVVVQAAVPAGAVAPSMNTAARVVAGDT
jgi:hypothetical protein